MSDTDEAREAVGRRLVEIGRRLATEGAAQVGERFTDHPEADALIRDSPDAFLIGVLFTQGIPAERAWAGPYLLRQRLGHLDLRRLAVERDAVAAAVAAAPALHRFKNTLGGWISDMAQRLVEDWGGSAANLWADRPSAAELRDRLEAFPGIGHKKAAMAVEILSRCFGASVCDPAGGTVAYDTQVRRVFLRSGLVDEDSVSEVERAAREASPAAPGTVDLPAWLIGRQWCRPRDPRCDECWLGESCPRHVDRSVEGVGVRPRKNRA